MWFLSIMLVIGMILACSSAVKPLASQMSVKFLSACKADSCLVSLKNCLMPAENNLGSVGNSLIVCAFRLLMHKTVKSKTSSFLYIVLLFFYKRGCAPVLPVNMRFIMQ